jgi:hypothetical protein
LKLEGNHIIIIPILIISICSVLFCSISLSQIQSPAWLLRAGDGPELTHMSLESFDLQMVIGESKNFLQIKLKLIGKGKFGIVYYAEHKQTARYVAIKFISKKILYETKGRERTQQVCCHIVIWLISSKEINILRMINHPFVVSYLGGFEVVYIFVE